MAGKITATGKDPRFPPTGASGKKVAGGGASQKWKLTVEVKKVQSRAPCRLRDSEQSCAVLLSRYQ